MKGKFFEKITLRNFCKWQRECPIFFQAAGFWSSAATATLLGKNIPLPEVWKSLCTTRDQSRRAALPHCGGYL
jgi:hypothetical protein